MFSLPKTTQVEQLLHIYQMQIIERWKHKTISSSKFRSCPHPLLTWFLSSLKRHLTTDVYYLHLVWGKSRHPLYPIPKRDWRVHWRVCNAPWRLTEFHPRKLGNCRADVDRAPPRGKAQIREMSNWGQYQEMDIRTKWPGVTIPYDSLPLPRPTKFHTTTTAAS